MKSEAKIPVGPAVVGAANGSTVGVGDASSSYILLRNSTHNFEWLEAPPRSHKKLERAFLDLEAAYSGIGVHRERQTLRYDL
jgi:hypothetical protein